MAFGPKSTQFLPKIIKASPVKMPKLPHVDKPKDDPFVETEELQDKRVGGLTRGLLKPFQQHPSRYIPKTKGFRTSNNLKDLAAAGKVKI
jgi:hypothetical protein